MKIFITHKQNFEIWEQFELMKKYRDIIVTFIQNGIIEDSPDQFIDLYDKFKTICNQFYTSLEDIYEKNADDLVNENESIEWNLDFTKKIYSINKVSKPMNEHNFIIGTLNIDLLTREKIEKIIK